MPTYDFQCDECKHEFEEFMYIVDYAVPTKCPKCKKPKVFRLYGMPATNIVKSESELTVGELAARNAAKFSDDKKEHLFNKNYGNRKHKPKFSK